MARHLAINWDINFKVMSSDQIYFFQVWFESEGEFMVRMQGLSKSNHIVNCADRIWGFSNFGRAWFCSCGRPDHHHIGWWCKCQCGVPTIARFRFFPVKLDYLKTGLVPSSDSQKYHVFYRPFPVPQTVHVCAYQAQTHQQALLRNRPHILVRTGGHSVRWLLQTTQKKHGGELV